MEPTNEEVNKYGCIVTLGVIVVSVLIGFLIGRGTALQIIYRDAFEIGYAEGHKKATSTTTILEEKKRCDEAGGKLSVIPDWYSENLEPNRTSRYKKVTKIACKLPERTAFEFEIE